jgi:microsomal epoxide hydrolase
MASIRPSVMADNPSHHKGSFPESANPKPQYFKFSINKDQVAQMQELIRLSPVAKDCYENQRREQGFGVTREWMLNTKKYWLEKFDW